MPNLINVLNLVTFRYHYLMEPNAEVREGIHLGIEYARRQ